jgi:hypothetical protein
MVPDTLPRLLAGLGALYIGYLELPAGKVRGRAGGVLNIHPH